MPACRKLVPQLIEHLVHLVHPVAPQTQGKPHAVHVLWRRVGWQEDRRKVSGRLVKAGVEQGRQGTAAGFAGTAPCTGPEDSADQGHGKEDQKKSHYPIVPDLAAFVIPGAVRRSGRG